MTWLLWRQHRMQTAIAAVGFALLAIVLVITGIHMSDTYQHALADTNPAGGARFDLFSNYTALRNLVSLSMLIPIVFGVAWGVTAVGRELDTGTHLLAWTQSVTKRTWLRGKIAVLLVMSALWGGAVTALVTWWYGPLNAVTGQRFDPGKFDIQGIVPVAYAIFGVSLGLAAGAILRRLLPAIGVTAGVFIALRLLVISHLRPHFMTPVTRTGLPFADFNLPNGSWVYSQLILLHGKVVNPATFPPQACTTGTREASDACISQLGYTSVVKYQPASRWWTFQWIESGLYVALAAALIVAAWVVVRRRDA